MPATDHQADAKAIIKAQQAIMAAYRVGMGPNDKAVSTLIKMQDKYGRNYDLLFAQPPRI